MSARGVVRYLPWMLRDAALMPGAAYLVLAAVFVFLLTRIPGDPGRPAPSPADVLASLVSGFDWLVVFLAAGGIVSGDLHSGVYRTLFSRPVTPALYYLQKWLVGGLAVAGFVAVSALAVYAARGSFVLPPPLLARMLLYYLLLGGLVFALSTLVRWDWPIALLLVILQAVLHAMDVGGEELGAVTRWLARALPPFHVPTVTRVTHSTYPPAGDLLHAAVYGATLVGIGLAVLWRRPMGSGGRS